MDEEELTDYFKYLDELRKSAVTNMFGAGDWLRRAFGIDKVKAANVLSMWMDTFDGKSSIAARVKEATAESGAV